MSKKFFDDEPTRKISGNEGGTAGQDQADPFSAKTVRVGSGGHDADATRHHSPAQGGGTGAQQSSHPLDDTKTRLVGPGFSQSSTQQTASSPAMTQDGPLVGWLVIMDGPGKGCSLPLGYGLNGIGRGSDQRVSLNFGDDQISRGTHFSIAYDNKNRQFYIQHGDAQNLTYLNDQPVLTPTVLSALDDISAGATLMRFVPFCGTDFDWSDLEESAPQ